MSTNQQNTNTAMFYLPQQGVLSQTHTKLIIADYKMVYLLGRGKIDPLLVEYRFLFLKPHIHEA